MCVFASTLGTHMYARHETIWTPRRPIFLGGREQNDFPSITANISPSGGPAVAKDRQ